MWRRSEKKKKENSEGNAVGAGRELVARGGTEGKAVAEGIFEENCRGGKNPCLAGPELGGRKAM